MVLFVGGASLRPSGVKLQQAILKETIVHSPRIMFHVFCSLVHHHKSHKPESENPASHKKSYRFDQNNFVWRGRHQRDETRMVLVKQKNARLHESDRRYAPGGEEPRGLNHNERPQMPQRREQRASKRCHLKPGEAETMAAHFQLPESRFLLHSLMVLTLKTRISYFLNHLWRWYIYLEENTLIRWNDW